MLKRAFAAITIAATVYAVTLGFLALTRPAAGTGSLTVSQETLNFIRKTTIAFVADTSGAVDTTTTERFTGELVQLAIIPDADTPFANEMDIEIGGGAYALIGPDLYAATNVDSTVITTQYIFGATGGKQQFGYLSDEPIRVIIAQADTLGAGELVLYFR